MCSIKTIEKQSGEAFFLKKDETTTLFDVVGNLEQRGELDKLNTLYEKERRKNRNSVKKQDHLNLIALKCVLINYGQKDRLTIIEQEILVVLFA